MDGHCQFTKSNKIKKSNLNNNFRDTNTEVIFH